MQNLKSYMETLHINVNYNYNEIIKLIRPLIYNSKGRLCRWLGGFETRKFQEDIFIVVTYIEIESEKYITGFVKIQHDESDPDFLTIDYICTDLYFKGIGYKLINLLKLILLNPESNIKKARAMSVLRPSTQNFYTQQKFYKLLYQPDPKGIFFEWNGNCIREEDTTKLLLFQETLKNNNPSFFKITYDPDKINKNKNQEDDTILNEYFVSECEINPDTTELLSEEPKALQTLDETPAVIDETPTVIDETPTVVKYPRFRPRLIGGKTNRKTNRKTNKKRNRKTNGKTNKKRNRK